MKKKAINLPQMQGSVKRLMFAFLFFSAWAVPSINAGNTHAGEKVAEETILQDNKVSVKGTITDESGEPLIGVSIRVKNSSQGTITDVDGNFNLSVPSTNSTLVFSYMGYATQEVLVGSNTSFNIVMKDDAQVLEQVVVTAMGIQRDAKKLGYSVSTIGTDELVKTSSPTLGSALYGKASGVRIQTAPGGAAGAISINVRGLNSITGNNQPLVVVDGVPIRNSNANDDGYWTDQRINSNGLADINPEDIENLSILKGASASALYGSEAANGVIMITTKSGKGTKGLGVDVSASLTGNFVAYMPEYQTTYGPGTVIRNRSGYKTIGDLDNPGWADGWYARESRNGTVHNSVMTATGQWGPKYDGSDILYYDGTVRKYNSYGSNQWSELFRTGFTQQYNVAVSNGNEKGNMRLAYTYIDDMPTQYNSSFKKHNFNLTGTYNISPKLKVAYGVNYIIQDIKNRPYRISRLTNNFAGMFSAFDDMDYIRNSTVTSRGYLNQYYDEKSHLTPDEGYEWKPAVYNLVDEYLWNVLAKEQLEKNNRLIANVTPSWQIIDGLTLMGRLGTDYSTEKIEKKESTKQSNLFGEYSGAYGLENRRYETVTGDIMLTFDRNITEKVGLTAMAGWNGRTFNTYNSITSTEGGLSVENWFHLNSSARAASAKMKKQELLRTAWLGTLGVSYDNWLYLDGTARQEKISTLAKGNNSFFYPSVSASAIISEVLKENKPMWLDYGKARISYGIVGNAPEIYRATQAYIQRSTSGYIYNTLPTKIGNENIKPEKKFEWEFGLEGKFLSNRIGFEASFYTNRVEDQILETTMPASAGGTSILLNVGELKNKGFELSVYGTPIRTKDWNWELRGNISFYKNEVTKLTEGVDQIEHWNLDGGAAYMYSVIGRPMGDIYAYVPKKDENGNNIVAADGFYELSDNPERVGNALPKFTGGFATTVAYKDFYLDAALDFRVGGAVMNIPYQYMMSRGSLVQSMKYRDAAHGGLTYYLDADNNCVPFSGTVGPNGEKVYDNGIILPGVKANGEKNDVMIGADYWYSETYGWGSKSGNAHKSYSQSIFDNTFVKMRELAIGYNLPEKLVSKFGCKKLQVSAFGRNLFYLYKRMPAMDAEATDATNWIGQTQIGGSTATTRSFGVSLRASF
ncbi:MAG: SusC/RagA family TonB-linked outer membrane protein [Dysgonomonas sp.]|nr:SusC/RagA family TonB-linked outer membrane protein [Dysgonomonas sp.]